MLLNNKSVKKNKILLLVSLILFVFSTAIFTISASSVTFVDNYSQYISSVIRGFTSFVTGWFEFSLFEWLIYLLPFVLLVSIVLIVKKRVKIKSILTLTVFLLSVCYFLFINSFGVCYFCSPVEERMNLDRVKIDRQELYNSSVTVFEKLENTLDDVRFNSDGSSKMKDDWRRTSELIDAGFDKLRDEYDFISYTSSVPKKIFASDIMTYTHISGVFMPLTGEANVNTNYPDYVVAFSMAHEKAHQRGIAGEDEANFIAFLALINSGDPYLEYSGYLSMYEYFLDAMYEHDYEMYTYMVEKCDLRVLRELYAYSKFFDEYRNSAASEVADTVNDTYIKAMGESDGVKSYGLVVELFSAYIKKKSLP